MEHDGHYPRGDKQSHCQPWKRLDSTNRGRR